MPPFDLHTLPRRLMLVTCATMALAACATSGTAQTPSLTGTEWRLSAIGDQAALEQPKASLSFGSEGRVSGHGGCNRFFGTYRQDADRLNIGPIASTRIGCPGPVGQQESQYLRALQKVSHARQQDGALLLQTAEGLVLRLLPVSSR